MKLLLMTSYYYIEFAPNWWNSNCLQKGITPPTDKIFSHKLDAKYGANQDGLNDLSIGGTNSSFTILASSGMTDFSICVASDSFQQLRMWVLFIKENTCQFF